MSWKEFRALLAGLGPDSPLARTVQIRLENNKDVIANFSSSQKEIRNKWRSRHGAAVASNEERDEFIRDLQKMLESR